MLSGINRRERKEKQSSSPKSLIPLVLSVATVNIAQDDEYNSTFEGSASSFEEHYGFIYAKAGGIRMNSSSSSSSTGEDM